ncbi:MAG: hypothetical protein KGL91_00985 [Xanthomonadaceae bacterium]|nr:hypothetical protein [Xanthomonadaceae bacterium]
MSTGLLPTAAWRAARLRDAGIVLALVLPVVLAVAVLVARFVDAGTAIGLLIAGLLLLAIVLRLRWRRRDAQWLVRALNAARPDMDDSADLLLMPSPSALQQLQQQRLVQRLHATPPDLRAAWPHRLLLASLLFAVCSIVLARWLPAPHALLQAPPATTSGAQNAAPRLQQVQLQVVPPAYTGMSGRMEPTLSIKTPAGSTLHWRLRFTGTAREVALVLLDGRRIALQNAADGWRASLVLAASQLYRVQVDGQLLDNGKLHRLDAIIDQPPQVTVQRPTQSLSLATTLQSDWALAFDARDDYGIQPTARLRLTLAQGSGENITFREHALLLTGQGTGRQRSFQHRLDLKALGMAEGDDLIVQLEVADNHRPQPQVARSPSLILRLHGKMAAATSDIEGAVRRVLPAYFRSQRQIIIDAEALQKKRRGLAAEAFLKQSDAIGVDQRILRLRYGQFLGEEAEGGPKTAPVADATSNTEEDDGHGAGHDTHAQTATGTAPMFGQIDHVLETFGHTHDIAEAATLLDPQTRATLKQALDKMWQSELHLRQGHPERALPFAYEALRFIKQVQQSERIYLARVGPELPPIDESRRLGGKRDGIAARLDALQLATQDDAQLVQLWQSLLQPGSVSISTQTLDAFDAWLRRHPGRAADPLALQAALDGVRRSSECENCRAALQHQLWPLLAMPPAVPLRRAAEDAQGRRYLDALQPGGKP